MTVRELIEQLQLIENQELKVVYGVTEYDTGKANTYLWWIGNPKYDIKHDEKVVNIGSLSDSE